MKKKVLLSFLLVIVLFLLTGCGKTDAEKKFDKTYKYMIDNGYEKITYNKVHTGGRYGDAEFRKLDSTGNSNVYVLHFEDNEFDLLYYVEDNGNYYEIYKDHATLDYRGDQSLYNYNCEYKIKNSEVKDDDLSDKCLKHIEKIEKYYKDFLVVYNME